ncbi:hypothetical protein ACFY1P_05525 [Streptomyces sp. NPDC001407]|uniref:hypothetical protein n=1 Tax=Streptomyces sp. NPDC001407 TaxID=3364573 RepID=UPI003690E003
MALVAAVLMTGCGSGGDKKSADEQSASTPPGTSGDSAATGPAGHYDGVYGARSDDGMIGMTIAQGKAVVYADNGKRACMGTVDEKDRPAKITLKCADGDTERTAGTVDRSDGKTLVVSWGAGRTDTFTKSGDPMPLPSPKKLGG